MKKALLFGLLCLFSLQIQSQQWQPFPLQQPSFWEQGSEIRLYYNDQVDTIDTNTSHLLFGRDYYYREWEQPCFDTIAKQVFQEPLPFSRIDTIIQLQNDIHPKGQASIVFRPWADPGESWTVVNPGLGLIDSIQWTCVNVTTAVIFGESLMVKNFLAKRYHSGDLVDEINVQLSADRGLIIWMPFEEWFQSTPSLMTLRGWKQGDNSAGFVNDFETYFGDFQVGDIYKYHTEQGGSGFACSIEKLEERDSVVSVLSVPEGVSVTYQRQFKSTCIILNEGGGEFMESITYGDTLVTNIYSRADYQQDLNATPDWFYYTDDPWGFDSLITLGLTSIIIADNNRIVTGAFNMELYDWSACYPGILDNCNKSYELMEGVGILREDMACLASGFNRELIGYQKGEEEWGDISQIVVSDKAEAIPTVLLKVIPNPNMGAFQIEIPEMFHHKAADIQIFGLNGQVVYQEKIASFTPFHSIALGQLSSGVYTLRLSNDVANAVSRVVLR